MAATRKLRAHVQPHLTLHHFEDSFRTREGRERLRKLVSTPQGREAVAELARDPAMVGSCGRVFGQRGGVKHFARLMGSAGGVETMRLIYANPHGADTAFRLFKTEGGAAAIKRMALMHPKNAVSMLYHQALSSAGTNPPGAPLETTYLGSNEGIREEDVKLDMVFVNLTSSARDRQLETAAEFFRRPEKTRALEHYHGRDETQRIYILRDAWRVMGADAARAMLSRVCNSDTGFQNLEEFMRTHPEHATQMLEPVVPKKHLSDAYALCKYLFKVVPAARPPATDHLQGGRISNDALHELFTPSSHQLRETAFQAFAECFSSDEKMKKFRGYLRGHPGAVKAVVSLLTNTERCVERTVDAFDSALAAEGGSLRLAEMLMDPFGTRVIASIKRTREGSLEVSSLFGKAGGREAIKELIESDEPAHKKASALMRAVYHTLFPVKGERQQMD